jgi:hypothetical protein
MQNIMCLSLNKKSSVSNSKFEMFLFELFESLVLLEFKAIFCHDKGPHKLDFLGLTYGGQFISILFILLQS